EQSGEQQADGDAGQHYRKEHQRTNQVRRATEHERVEQGEAIAQNDLTGRDDERVQQGEPDCRSNLRVLEEPHEIVESDVREALDQIAFEQRVAEGPYDGYEHDERVREQCGSKKDQDGPLVPEDLVHTSLPDIGY